MTEPSYATSAAVAGLAAEVEGVRRRLDKVDDLPEQVRRLGELLDQLSATVEEFTSRAAPRAIPSWLMAPADPAAVEAALGELAAWLEAVWLRYPDAAAVLPECWAWHPEVIEELTWLMHAWLAAYQGPSACVALAGDWHDRQRPGVVRRLKEAYRADKCSLEQHTPPVEPATVPLPAAVSPLAAWWATRREQAPPEPTAEQFAAVEPCRRTGGARR